MSDVPEKVGLTTDLRAHAILLQRQLDAITGVDIAHIRHSDGGIDLAKRVVNLKNAADWMIQAVAALHQEQDDA